MNIAVTGANGFLGKFVAEELKKRGFNPTLFDKSLHNLLQPKTLKDFVLEKDVIIHLAGVNRGTDNEIMSINALGTKRLINAIATYGSGAKLIFASTFQVYVKGGVYGDSKRQAEEYINTFAKKHGIKAIIFRIANIYGPGCKPYYNSVIATFVDRIRKGKPLIINGDGAQKRDYVYVLDVAKAIVLAITYVPKTVEYFDICSGKQIMLNTIVEYLRKLSKKNIEVVYNKGIKSYDFGIERNYKKAGRLLSWRPTITLKEGLKETLNREVYEN